jgi:hypothetical protein
MKAHCVSPASATTNDRLFRDDLKVAYICAVLTRSQHWATHRSPIRGNQRLMKTYKIVVFVPEADGEAVRMAMGEAGAGRIGNYDYCSFTSGGTGRFRPLEGARPAIGEVGQLEDVAEERIETVCSDERLKAVLAAIHRVHPYEEPAIDLYTLVAID